MQSELKSLSKIFSESIFRIPDYQRGYSWQEKHLKDFWSDLVQLPPGKSHYTGVLTLEPVNETDYSKWEDDLWIIKSKLYTPLYVVDGQQRLTTAIVLLQAMLESISDDDVLNYTTKSDIKKKYIFESKDKGISRSYIFGYEKDNPSYEFLKRSIYGEASEVHSIIETTIYTANLEAAKKFFLSKISKLSIDDLAVLYTKLTQHLHFNIFYIEPELDVFVTFETMNNRGKPLSHLELLKNRLIYLSTRFEEDVIDQERLRRKINESWKTIYHYLGKKSSRTLHDDLFLRTHFLSYFGPELPKVESDDLTVSDYDFYNLIRHDERFKNYLLEETFTVRRLYDTCTGPKLSISEMDNYAQDIKRSVELYYCIFDPDSGPFGDQEKVLLKSLARAKRHESHFLCLIILQIISDSDTRIVMLKSLERFNFLFQVQPYYFRDIGLEQLGIKLKAADLTPEEIIRQIDGICTKFVNSPEFPEAIRNIGKSDGYYGWKGLKYFMFEYEQQLRVNSKTSRRLLCWDTFNLEDFESDHKSIEHIYPQKASDQYWKSQFAKYAVADRNTLRNSLGNLLPASIGKNSSLSNKSFSVKCGSVTNQVGYRYGCLSEIQVSQQADWGATHIAARGLILLKFMEERWNFSLGSDDKKLKLLGLDFVLNREGINIERLKDNYITAPLRVTEKEVVDDSKETLHNCPPCVLRVSPVLNDAAHETKQPRT
jgi:hypothetical protein